MPARGGRRKAVGVLPSEPEATLRRIGPYRVERRLGAGGMGVVYLGRDDAGAPVAVKVIKPEYAADRRFRARLRREVAAARRVPRFCTAPVVGADLDTEPPYIATEYIDGPTLDVAVLERGPLRGAELEGLATGIAVALRAIHEQGVIHRDLKPSNILLSSVGPRVIDFGIARLEDAETQLTQDGTVVGTLAYMAPEQLREEELTAAVDLFAWAGMVTYAATGRPPFGTDREVRQRILTQDPDVGALDEPLRGLVEAAFAKDTARRPSAADLIDRLSSSRPAMTTQILETATVLPSPPADDDDRDSAEPDGRPLGPRGAPRVSVRPSIVWPDDDVRPVTQPHARSRNWRWIRVLVAVALVSILGTIWLNSRDNARPRGFGTQLGDPFTGHSGHVQAVAAGTLDGRSIAVSGGGDKTLRVWDLAKGGQIGEPLKGHRDPIYAVQVGAVNGRTFAVSGGGGVGGSGFLGFGKNDNSLRIWDLATHRQIGEPLEHDDGGNEGGPDSVAIGTLNGRPIAVSANKTLRMWDLGNGTQIGGMLAGNTPVAISVVNGRTYAVSDCLDATSPSSGGCDDGAAVRWDLAERKRSGKPLTGKDPDVFTSAAAIGELGGRPIVVAGTSADDHALRMWDLNTGDQIGKPLRGHTHNVFSVAIGELRGRTIAVSGSVDQTVRVWDLMTGKQIGQPFTGHKDNINAVAIGELDGRPVVVSGSDDETVRVWDLGPPYPAP